MCEMVEEEMFNSPGVISDIVFTFNLTFHRVHVCKLQAVIHIKVQTIVRIKQVPRYTYLKLHLVNVY